MESFEIQTIIEANAKYRRCRVWALSGEERIARFEQLQEELLLSMSDNALRHFHRRNHQKRSVRFENGTWLHD